MSSTPRGRPSNIEALLARRTGRPRHMKVRALLVALLLLALDDRPLHLKAATKLLFCVCRPLAGRARHNRRSRGRRPSWPVTARSVTCSTSRSPSSTPRSRPRTGSSWPEELAAWRKKLSDEEVAARQRPSKIGRRLARGLGEGVLGREELAGFDGSVGLDATPVPLWSRGPSARRGPVRVTPTGAGM